MAVIRYINGKTKRKKKWLHFKMKVNRYVFKLSIVGNIVTSFYFAEKYGYLLKLIELYNTEVAPIMESLINQLPL